MRSYTPSGVRHKGSRALPVAEGGGAKHSVNGSGSVWYHNRPAAEVEHLAIITHRLPASESPAAPPVPTIEIRVVTPPIGALGYPVMHTLTVPASAASAFRQLAELLHIVADEQEAINDDLD